MENFQRVLILAPHTDDGELGCGGTMSRFIREGKEVFYTAFAYPKGCSKKLLNKELMEAMKVLKVPAVNVSVGKYNTRYFPQRRQEILDDMIVLDRKIKPDLVLIPSSFDRHQDHQVIYQEAFRAFKKCSILGYEEPWNNVTFKTDVFVKLDETDINKKIEVLSYYKSQSERFFFEGNFIKSLAKTRGVQISTNYAEAFEIIRWII